LFLFFFFSLFSLSSFCCFLLLYFHPPWITRIVIKFHSRQTYSRKEIQPSTGTRQTDAGHRRRRRQGWLPRPCGRICKCQQSGTDRPFHNTLIADGHITEDTRLTWRLCKQHFRWRTGFPDQHVPQG
jgi:hypothetical protein